MDNTFTFSDLTAPFEKKKVFYLTYRSDNRATLSLKELQQVRGNLYRGRTEPDSFDQTSCVLYAYFEEHGFGVDVGCVREPEKTDMEEYLSKCDLSLVQSTQAFLLWLDQAMEEKKFINNAIIALVEKIAPDRASLYAQARQAYIDENKRKDEERQRVREERDATFCKEENEKADAIVNQAVCVLRMGGELENTFITHYRGRYDGMTSSVINCVAGRYGVTIPISVQGWINRSLASVTIKDGKVARYFRRGKGRSETVCGYINQVVMAVCAAAEKTEVA